MQKGNRLSTYYIVSVSLRLCQGFFTKYVGYNANCIGAVT